MTSTAIAQPTASTRPRRGHRVIAKRWEQEIPAELVIEMTVHGETEELRLKSILPFLPRQGDQIGLGPDGDYLEVDEVFWCKEEGLSVWFVPEPQNRRHTITIFRDAGWLPWDEFRLVHRPV